METIHQVVFPSMSINARSVVPAEIGAYIECARASLSILQIPRRVEQCDGLILSCLLCQGGETDHTYDARSLVSVQEHLMERHGLTRKDFQTAIRLNKDGDEGFYLWAVLPGRSNELHLSHCCYLQAVRSDVHSQTKRLVISTEETSLEHWVTVVRRDEQAYYGCPHEMEQGGSPLIFPLREWMHRRVGFDGV